MLQRASGDDNGMDFIPAQAHIEQALNHGRFELLLDNAKNRRFRHGRFNPEPVPNLRRRGIHCLTSYTLCHKNIGKV
jgi:hypothetical protein